MTAVTATYELTYELSPKMTGRRRGKSCLEINLSTGCIDFLFFLVYKVSSGNPQDCTGQACHTFSGITSRQYTGTNLYALAIACLINFLPCLCSK